MRAALGHFRQSKRRASAFLEDLLNIPCSAGWTVKIQTLVSDVLATPYEELRGELSQEPQLFIDESPTKQKNDKAWLWVAVAPMFVVFGIFLSRKRDALKRWSAITRARSSTAIEPRCTSMASAFSGPSKLRFPRSILVLVDRLANGEYVVNRSTLAKLILAQCQRSGYDP